MKKVVYLLIIMLLMVPVMVQAKSKVQVYIFTKDDEEYSDAAIDYFKELKESDLGEYFEYHNVKVWDKNWQQDEAKRKIADKVASYFDDTLYGAPYIVVGSKYKLTTYSEDSNEEIEEALQKAIDKKDYVDLYKKAEKEIITKQRKDALSLVGIASGIVIITGLFIYFARKNND